MDIKIEDQPSKTLTYMYTQAFFYTHTYTVTHTSQAWEQKK